MGDYPGATSTTRRSFRRFARRPHLLPRKTIQVLAGPAVDLADLRSGPVDAAVLATATGRVMAAITGQLRQLRHGSTGPQEP